MTPLEKCGRMKAVIYKGYYDLPAREHHPAIDAFQRMASRLDSTNPPDEAELEAAYAEARPHVERLIERGKLKGDLDGDATGEIGAADAAAPEALKPLGVAAAPVVETTANAKDEPQATPMPEQPVAVEQEQQEPVDGAAPAAQEALWVAAAPITETTKTATDEPNAPEPEATPAPTPARRNTRRPVNPPQEPACPGNRRTSTSAKGAAPQNVEIDTSDIDTIPIPPPKFPVHPLANILPMMSAPELRALGKSIRRSGGLGDRPMTRLDGLTLDGRNRDVASQLAGTEHTFVDWHGEAGSPLAFVLRENVHRRNLSEQQRAMVAVRIKQTLEAEAIDRRNANLLQNKGSTDGLDPGHRSGGRSAQLAADALNVSRDAVNKAGKVLKEGAAELVAAVEQGAVSLDAGAAVATLPVEEQREVVEQGMAKEKAKELRDARAKAKTKADKPKDTAAQPQVNAADTAHGEQQTHGEQPEARADAQSSSATSSSTSTFGEKPASDNSSTTAATETAAQEQADAKPTASETATTEAKPTAPKFTVEQLICMTVNRAAKKPSLAPEIIHRTAEAAGIEVLIVDSVTRDAVKELANLLPDKLGDLAANNYEDACDLLTGIDEDLWAAVNAHAPEDEDAELEDDEGEDDWSEGDDDE